ncbi:MAG: histidine phosphatase family protein [Erythrobacter sp.]|nr:histidine phosphatase family protein [Erythrobacter sp.]
MAVILLRHAEPEIAPGICYGRSDVGARVPDGEELAALLASLPRSLARIDSSPLRRCTALAGRIAETLDLPLRIDDRLAEIDFGRWEMQAWDDIPRGEIDCWAADVEGARPHGGETVAEMIGRVRAYLDDRRAAQETVLAVAHLGTARCAHAALGREDPFALKLGYRRFLVIDPEGES